MTTSRLNVEHLSKESFIDMMNFIIYTVGINKVFVSEKKPVKSGTASFTNEFRLDIPLSGLKHMMFASEGRIHDVLMKPGEIHCCPPLNWKLPEWDYLHEMSSIIYYPDYIRFTYIDFKDFEHTYKSCGADIYYHTSQSLHEDGRHVLKTIHSLIDHQDDTAIIELVTALLKITLRELENDIPISANSVNLTKLRIRQYIEDNFHSAINRNHVAQVFGITPTYVSRLFMEDSDEGFNQMLRRLRLEHAALLLKNSNMSVKEITDACGYLSSTYFIAAFKKFFGVPPGKYRRIN